MPTNKTLIFMILDQFGIAWGVAPTALQARVQIAWFLPKDIELRIEPCLVERTKIEDESEPDEVGSSPNLPQGTYHDAS